MVFEGFRGVWRLKGSNLNQHEQDHSKKPMYFRSIDGMHFPNFTFALRVINERHNQGYNRLSFDTALATVGKDPTYRISLAVKRLCGGAVGVLAPTLSCACLTAWGGWTLYFFRQCWRSRFRARINEELAKSNFDLLLRIEFYLHLIGQKIITKWALSELLRKTKFNKEVKKYFLSRIKSIIQIHFGEFVHQDMACSM